MDAYLLDDEKLAEFISLNVWYYRWITESRDFLDFFLPLIRSDIKLVETYRHQNILKIHCPGTFMTGIRDSLVDGKECQLWAKCTTGPFSVLKFDDGHFFNKKI